MMRGLFSIVLVLCMWVTPVTRGAADTPTTAVSIVGEEFHLNGQPLHAGRFYQGHRLQGLLFNARLVQGIFDDRNPETVGRWAYPDTGRWDPERNTREFIEAMVEWRRHGLDAFTLNLQGGSPEGYSRGQPWENTAFEADGALRPEYFQRLERILRRADELGMVVILGLFYFGQDERLADEAAVIRAVDGTVDWLFAGGWRHVLIEINNECNVRYDHPILQPERVHELIERVRGTVRDGRRFLVSTSYGGGTLPGPEVVRSADFLLLHGNGVGEPAQIADMVRRTRALAGETPKPILFNEDDHFDFDRPYHHFLAAVTERAGWGYFDYRQRGESFEQGFQSVPVDWSISSERKRGFFRTLARMTGVLPLGAEPRPHVEARWWKGNLHTHSLWSDGDDYPEMIADWYKAEGYHFLAFSDHNLTLEGQRWFPVSEARGGGAVLEKYKARWGVPWVEERVVDGRVQVRLKPLAEFRPLFEEAGRFLLLAGQEITDRHLAAPVHLNASHIRDFIPPQGGGSVFEVMQRNVNAVLAQRQATGQPMVPHINHPNFGWAITAEELLRLRGEPFFEVYNGHPHVFNDGDQVHAGLERVWDIVLAWRLGILGLPPMFGLAVDDGHHYHTFGVGQSNAGRGWLMVRARHLTPESLMEAMEAGDFYASTGVQLQEVAREGPVVRLVIQGEPGITYSTEFVGTRRGFDTANEPVRTAAGDKLRVTHRYHSSVGEILARSESLTPEYRLEGDELYVRAVVRSSKLKDNGYREGEFEVAWTQPFRPE